jgi:hypothetical protein
VINRKHKGTRGEQVVARALGVRRGLQFRGAELPDVDLPGWWPEVKTRRRPNIGGAFAQAKEEAREGREPCAITKADRGPWLVTMTLEAFAWLLRREGSSPPSVQAQRAALLLGRCVVCGDAVDVAHEATAAPYTHGTKIGCDAAGNDSLACPVCLGVLRRTFGGGR